MVYSKQLQLWVGFDVLRKHASLMQMFFVCWTYTVYFARLINTLRPRQNGRHFAGDIFKYIFLNENVWIPIEISLKFVPKGPINNIPALVRIMAWRRPGDKLLSEPMMVRLPAHICVTRPQWVDHDPLHKCGGAAMIASSVMIFDKPCKPFTTFYHATGKRSWSYRTAPGQGCHVNNQIWHIFNIRYI